MQLEQAGAISGQLIAVPLNSISLWDDGEVRENAINFALSRLSISWDFYDSFVYKKIF